MRILKRAKNNLETKGLKEEEIDAHSNVVKNVRKLERIKEVKKHDLKLMTLYIME